MAVVSGQTDLATDYNINREVMIEQGRIPADATQVYWQSEELPLEAIAFPKDFDREMAMRIQRLLLDLPAEQARAMLPLGFDGFVPATHETFRAIENAGIVAGRIKPQS
jgi:phosphonate transport system substrate-binding protein